MSQQHNIMTRRKQRPVRADRRRRFIVGPDGVVEIRRVAR